MRIRKKKRQRGYMHRLMALRLTVGFSNAQVQHDADCKSGKTGKSMDCNCVPDILVSGPNGLYEVNLEGEIVPARAKWQITKNPLSKVMPHVANN